MPIAWPNQTQEALDYFKFRFPELAGRGDGYINIMLTEAKAEIGDTWAEADRDLAANFLAAHKMTTQGTNTVGRGELKRRKVGDVETEYAGNGTGRTGYATTVYGQEYLKILRRNFPAVAVV